MIEFLQSLNPMTWYLTFIFMIMVAAGIATLGGFVSSRLKAKDKLRIEQTKREVSIANANRDTQLSQERTQAMALRALEIENGFPRTYIPMLDDSQSKKARQKELG